MVINSIKASLTDYLHICPTMKYFPLFNSSKLKEILERHYVNEVRDSGGLSICRISFQNPNLTGPNWMQGKNTAKEIIKFENRLELDRVCREIFFEHLPVYPYGRDR